MPLARIDLAEGKTADYRRAIGEVVYDAQVEVLKAPKDGVKLLQGPDRSQQASSVFAVSRVASAR